MSDPKWYARLPKPVQKLVDQVAHAAIGAAIAGLVGGLSRLKLSPLWAAVAGASASVLGAVVYELVQNLGDESNNVADAILDSSVWSLGGAAVGLTIWGVGYAQRRKR